MIPNLSTKYAIMIVWSLMLIIMLLRFIILPVYHSKVQEECNSQITNNDTVNNKN
jgi:hypothetical protein